MPNHLQPFQSFITTAIEQIQQDPHALGLAVGRSWASGELDAYSDLDLVVVTSQEISPELAEMRDYAAKFGSMLASFRGDHVGESRLLIVLYEAIDFLAFVRSAVLGPMLHLKNSSLPRGVRRAETTFKAEDLTQLRQTVATPDRTTLLSSLWEVMYLYESLRDALTPDTFPKKSGRSVSRYNLSFHALELRFAVIIGH